MEVVCTCRQSLIQFVSGHLNKSFLCSIENIPNPTADASVGLCVVIPEQSDPVAEVTVGAGGLPVLTPKEDPEVCVGVASRI